MEISFSKNKALSSLLFILYIIFIVSIIYSFRAISSICIGCIILTGIIKNRMEYKPFIQKKNINLFCIALFVFYGLQWIALLYTQDRETAWKDIQLKTALVFIPLAVCSFDYLNKITTKKMLDFFILSLVIACFYCLVMASFSYSHSHRLEVFFYHTLVWPLSQHAVYFSILIYISLVVLIENAGNRDFLLHKFFHWFLIAFFSFFLFLLSSKLVICFYLLYLLYYITTRVRSKKKNRLIISSLLALAIGIGCLLFATNNPVRSRFRELITGDMTLFAKQKYNPGIYFNDIQFRLVEWKFVNEILNEQQAWLIGVSPGDGQANLNQKYISSGMYVGNRARGATGFLNYNTHNQLLESLLKTGIVGVLFFLFICFAMLRLVWKMKNRFSSFIILLLLAFSLNESVFETQYAMVLFIFFPLFFNRATAIAPKTDLPIKQPASA